MTLMTLDYHSMPPSSLHDTGMLQIPANAPEPTNDATAYVLAPVPAPATTSTAMPAMTSVASGSLFLEEGRESQISVDEDTMSDDNMDDYMNNDDPVELMLEFGQFGTIGKFLAYT